MWITEPLPLNELAIRHNAAMLEYCRTSISALSGSTAGILGLTGLYGFAFYFLTAFMMSVCTVCSSYTFVYIFFLYFCIFTMSRSYASEVLVIIILSVRLSLCHMRA